MLTKNDCQIWIKIYVYVNSERVYEDLADEKDFFFKVGLEGGILIF